jgi:hypothetical protein
MHTNRLGIFVTGVFALLLTLLTSSVAFGQSVTTSAINGFVTDKAGQPVGGVTVTAVHVPSGTRSVTTTRSNGEYNIDGLRTGGPYTVSIAGGGVDPQAKPGYMLEVGSADSVNFSGSSDIVTMAGVSVEGTRDTLFDASAMGSNIANYNSAQIQQISSVRQDVQDIADLDPRAAVMQSAQNDSEYTISFQGQNPRSNLFLIDGVSATDNFGLNSNGYAGLRNPLPFPWIESFSVKLNEYDLAFGGYSGGLMDATLKSGTNEFHGSLYEEYTGTRFRGPDPIVGLLGPHEPEQQHTYGGTIGGPIIKDKLFFFFGYEAYREIAGPPPEEFFPSDSNAAGGGTAQITSILAKFQSYGWNPGTFTAVSHIWEQNAVMKIDWNISDAQKFEFTFRHTDGLSPLYYDYSLNFETSTSNSWYASHRVDQSYTAKFNSDWSSFVPGLTSEIEGTYKRYNGTAEIPNSAYFPAVTINNVLGYSTQGGVAPFEFFGGTNANYQLNNVYTWDQEEHAYADYSVGAHTFKFGVQADRIGYTDTFIPNALGSYSFSNVADWLAGTPTAATIESPLPGFTFGSAVSHYYLLNVAPILQDTWKPNSQLTILAGVRMDYPYEPQKPPLSQIFVNDFGFSNQGTINGNYTISPRIGFNYTLPTEQKTQIHGGAGLFLGQSPVVWLENSFNNAGQLGTAATASGTAPLVNNNGTPFIFTGNPATQAAPPTTTAASIPSFDFADPNIKQPANWKENLSIDHELPFWHLTVTAMVDFSQVQKDLYYQDINIVAGAAGQPAYMPDGAIRYAGVITPTNIGTPFWVPGYSSANFYATMGSYASTAATNPLIAQHSAGATYGLYNTDKGGSQEYSLQISRPMKDNWAWSAAYSHTHATQVYQLGGTTANGSYTTNYFVNPNDNVAYRSQYATPDKFVLTLTRRFHFIPYKDSPTTISAQFLAQTGEAYSYTFKGDADGSGVPFSPSLFYVPTGPSDPKVAWLSPTEEANFFTYLAANPDLAKYAGSIAPRNAFYSPWQKTVNLHVEQSIPIYGSAKFTIFGDCYNFANLLNKNWGAVQNYGVYNGGSSASRTVAGTGYNAAGNAGQGQYIYVFNAGTLGAATTPLSDLSRWMIQVGARLDF